MKKILILEDELSIREFIVFNFQRAGYQVFEAGLGAEAISVFESNQDIPIAILDVMLPDIDGFEVCRKLRSKNHDMGIIMLTAKDLDEDVLNGFSSGADDYLTKPVSPKVLVAKADALFRRIAASSNNSQTVAKPEEEKKSPFELNEKRKSARKNGVDMDLTPVEFSILKYFLSHPDQSVSREDLLTEVWGDDYTGNTNIVNVNIRRLRLKIEDNPSKPTHLLSERGEGYYWQS